MERSISLSTVSYADPFHQSVRFESEIADQKKHVCEARKALISKTIKVALMAITVIAAGAVFLAPVALLVTYPIITLLILPMPVAATFLALLPWQSAQKGLDAALEERRQASRHLDQQSLKLTKLENELLLQRESLELLPVNPDTDPEMVSIDRDPDANP